MRPPAGDGENDGAVVVADDAPRDAYDPRKTLVEARKKRWGTQVVCLEP